MAYGLSDVCNAVHGNYANNTRFGTKPKCLQIGRFL